MLTDTYNRKHTYLRISLTDRCNLRCFYCMPQEDMQYAPQDSLMQADEIYTLAETFVKAGVTKIRLTGGEPLLRKDFSDILQALSFLPVELTLSTNAVNVHKHIDALKLAGTSCVNVSLDTLQPDTFLFIAKRDYFNRVQNNIQLLLENNIRVKINVVVTRGINDGEINDFIAWTKDTPIDIRFIEFMPFTGNAWQSNRVFSKKEILSVIENHYDFYALPREQGATANSYKVAGYAGNFSIISTMTHSFCSDCNRIRLTSDGKLKNCLFSTQETDLLSALRQGKDVKTLIQACIQSKAKEHGGQFTSDDTLIHASQITNRSMIAIGG